MMEHAHLSCRARFTPADFDFMIQCLGQKGKADLTGLMRDPECLDRMLDDGRLIRVVLDLRGCLRISMPFYFYVLVRHALRHADFDNRDVSDYLAAKLSEFADHDRMRRPLPEPEGEYGYLSDLLEAAERSHGEKRFRLQLHLGDYALLSSGMFPRHVLRRVERRAAPGLDFYEQLGSASYRLAGQDGRAEKLGLVSVLLTLCQAFHTARLALNQLSDRMVFLDQDRGVEGLLRELG